MPTCSRTPLFSTKIAFAFAFAGCLMGCGGDEPACPHSVVDSSTPVALAPANACALLQKVTVGYFGPHIPLEECRTACGDTEITECFLPREYADKTLGDAGPCPAPDGGTEVTLTCQVSHTEGTSQSRCPTPP